MSQTDKTQRIDSWSRDEREEDNDFLCHSRKVGVGQEVVLVEPQRTGEHRLAIVRVGKNEPLADGEYLTDKYYEHRQDAIAEAIKHLLGI